MASYLTQLMHAQKVRPIGYAEPFAGGAGAALSLLVNEAVERIHINDLSAGIAAFWRSVFHSTEELAAWILNASVTMDDWYRHREIFESPGMHDDLTLGFSTFFLNRCNRSGILSAGPIGGVQQLGNWKLDVRFNRSELAERVLFIGQYRERVSVTQLDAKAFLSTVEHLGNSLFVYVDPPYIVQGEALYLNSLSYDDHVALAAYLAKTALPWILTYDIAEQVTDSLYCGFRIARFNIAHTAQKQHVGSEYIVFSDQVLVPNLEVIKQAQAQWVVA